MSDVTTLIGRRLEKRTRRVVDDPSQRRAAVLVPLYTVGEEVFVLFTKRTETVEHHKGQISFPGGVADAQDPDLLTTALRETREELGIPSDQVQILGVLDDVSTYVSGFVITPFVGIIPHPYPLRVNANEISEVLTVPLRAFRDATKLRIEERDRAGERVKVYFYQYGAHEIWGATARIMKEMIDAAFEGESA